MLQLYPDDLDTTSNSFSRSSPNASAKANASQETIIVAPKIMLLHILAAWPAPAFPQCTALLPMISNSGRANRNASFVPPAMNVNLPPVAPATPPETGASTNFNPAASAFAATASALAMSTVEQSTNVDPRRMAVIVSSATLLSAAPFGSIVMTTSLPFAAFAADSAGFAPFGYRFVMSKHVTE